MSGSLDGGGFTKDVAGHNDKGADTTARDGATSTASTTPSSHTVVLRGKSTPTTFALPVSIVRQKGHLSAAYLHGDEAAKAGFGPRGVDPIHVHAFQRQDYKWRRKSTLGMIAKGISSFRIYSGTMEGAGIARGHALQDKAFSPRIFTDVAIVWRAFPGMSSPGAILRQLLNGAAVVLPGAPNGLTAIAIRSAGFEACYLSGAALTASIGVPDIGVLGKDRFCTAIRDIRMASGIPVLADADTGFGGEGNIDSTVKDYIAAGAAGFHIEDQVFPKRCGHLSGKKLVPAEEFVKKIKAAVKARNKYDPEFIVCARTDAASIDGMPEVIRRSKLYLDAGADMIFPEGLRSKEEFSELAKELKGEQSGVEKGDIENGKVGRLFPYLVANMTEFGVTEPITVEEFEKMGYNAVLFPVSTLRASMGATVRMLEELRDTGQVHKAKESMLTRQDLYKLLRYEPDKKWDYPYYRENK